MSRLLIPQELVGRINDMVDLGSGIEHGFFATIKPVGSEAYIVQELLEPIEGDWQHQGPDQLQPTSAYIMRAVDMADVSGLGLLFMHTHPHPLHPPTFSHIDRQSLAKLGGALGDMLSAEFIAGIVGVKGWFAAKYAEAGFEELDSIVEVGGGYRLLNYAESEVEDIDDRQVRSLGSVNQSLRKLTVAVVGAGGLGSAVAEQLVRCGVKKILLVDHDRIDTVSNLRRIYGTKMSDFDVSAPRFKVDVVGDYLRSLNLGVDIQSVPGDIKEQAAIDEVLAADILINATDTHGSRAAINSLPYVFGIPVVDIGVRVAKDNVGPAGFFAAVRIFTPDLSCMLCRGVISPERVRIENYSAEDLAAAQKEGYVPGEFGEPEPSIISLTTVAAGMGVSALINLLLDTEDRYTGLTFELLEGYAVHHEQVQKDPGCIYCSV